MPVDSFDGSLDWFANLIRGVDDTTDDARRRLIDLLRGEPDMRKFVRTFDKWSLSREGTSRLDAVANKAKVSRALIIGAITRVLHQMTTEIGKVAVTAACTQSAPMVADTMVRSALDPQNGHKDRRLVMEILQAVKQPGVPNINVNAQANNSTVNAEKAVVFSGGAELPSFEEGTRRMGAALRAIRSADEE